MTVVFVVSTPGKLLVLQLAQLIDRVSLPACRSVRLQVCQLLKIWDVSLIILVNLNGEVIYEEYFE